MLLLRLIILVGPVLGVILNVRNDKKTQKLDLTTSHVQTLNLRIEELREQQQRAEREIENGKNTRNRRIINKRKQDLLDATNNLNDAIKKRNGKSSTTTC